MGKVVKNRRLNDYLTSLIIDAPSPPDFEAGQFVRVGLYDGDGFSRGHILSFKILQLIARSQPEFSIGKINTLQFEKFSTFNYPYPSSEYAQRMS